MVAFLFPGAEKKLLHPRPVCFARRTLFIAQHALERGQFIEAGCQMREAVREFLFALCTYHQCLPSKQATPSRMAHALLKANQLDDDGHGWIRDMIETGNKAAHCKYVRPSLIECCISLLHSLLDISDELQLPSFEREGGEV